MATPFETFVNTELPKRLATNVSPTAPQAGEVPVFTGVGLLTENKSLAAAGIQAALANVITAGTYGNTTQYPVLTFNAKGICTGITLQTVNATFLTEANFAVEKTGASAIKVTWILTALTTARAWTIPDKAINLGDLPSIATTNSNVLSGIRTRILGGSSNTVSGTDNVAIECTGVTLNGVDVTAINVANLAANAVSWENAIILGSSYSITGEIGGGLNVLTNTTTISQNGAGTFNAVSAAGAVSSSNCAKLALGILSSGVHEIDFIIQHNNDYSNVGTISGKRRVIAFSDSTGAITVSSVNTPYADLVFGSSTGLVFSVTLDTANNRLVPTLTATGVGTIFGLALQAKVTSYYTKKTA